MLFRSNYYEYIKAFWKANVLAEGDAWEKAQHDGFYRKEAALLGEKPEALDTVPMVAALTAAPAEGFELTLYTKTGLGDGQQANNPWLQELPDPITRVSWDNYLTMSAADAKELGIKNWHVANGALDGDYAQIQVGDVTLKVPVLIQPGQAKGSVGLAFGYEIGRAHV